MTDDELPGSWQWAGGEASRPLHDGGYYLHVATMTIWENQHKRRYIEARVDTADYTSTEGPRRHVLEITEREEDFNLGHSWDVETLEIARTNVEDRNDPDSQDDAEDLIHDLAKTSMASYAEEYNQ